MTCLVSLLGASSSWHPATCLRTITWADPSGVVVRLWVAKPYPELCWQKCEQTGPSSSPASNYRNTMNCWVCAGSAGPHLSMRKMGQPQRHGEPIGSTHGLSCKGCESKASCCHPSGVVRASGIRHSSLIGSIVLTKEYRRSFWEDYCSFYCRSFLELRKRLSARPCLWIFNFITGPTTAKIGSTT